MVIAMGILDEVSPNSSGVDLRIRQKNGGKVLCHFPRKGQLEYFRNAIELLNDASQVGRWVELTGRDNTVRVVRFL